MPSLSSLSRSFRRRNLRGFTMIELIVVMILVGILAAVALPRFADKRTFDTRGYADQVISTLRYGQKTAIAQRRRVLVSFNEAADNVSLNWCDVAAGADTCTAATTACNGAVTNPASAGPYVIEAPDNVQIEARDAASVAVAAFRFDCLGRPMATDTLPLATATTVTVLGDANVPVVIEAETGYVH